MFLRRLLFLFFLILFCVSCSSESEETDVDERSRSEVIIDSAIAVTGGDLLDNGTISFTFRNRAYLMENDSRKFLYQSSYQTDFGFLINRLNNAGFERSIDSKPIVLSESDSLSGAAALNSVIYFAFLPYQLKAQAVNSSYGGMETIGEVEYHKINVSFDKEGGGRDHEDEFIYWIHPETYKVDFLAYSFEVNDGGTRFRQAKNSRHINGILFQDYNNFKGPADPDSLKQISRLFNEKKLELFTEIKLENIRIDLKE